MSKPSHQISIRYNNIPKTITMSFGLLNTLITHIKDPMDLINVGADADLAYTLIGELLAVRDNHGVAESYPDMFLLEHDEAAKALNWAGSHILNFFTTTLSQNSKDLGALNSMMKTTQQRGTNG